MGYFIFSAALMLSGESDLPDGYDHFTFLMDDDGEWRLAPAYDLTFSSGPGGEHMTDVAGMGRDITDGDMLNVAKDAGIEEARAKEIIDQVQSITAHSADYADRVGLSTLFRV